MAAGSLMVIFEFWYQLSTVADLGGWGEGCTWCKGTPPSGQDVKYSHAYFTDTFSNAQLKKY